MNTDKIKQFLAEYDIELILFDNLSSYEEYISFLYDIDNSFSEFPVSGSSYKASISKDLRKIYLCTEKWIDINLKRTVIFIIIHEAGHIIFDDIYDDESRWTLWEYLAYEKLFKK